jgi:hypothetical protein
MGTNLQNSITRLSLQGLDVIEEETENNILNTTTDHQYMKPEAI